MLLLTFCIGFALTQWASQDQYPVISIEANGVYYIALRLIIYGLILAAWSRWIKRIYHVVINQGQINGRDKAEKFEPGISYRYRMAMYLLVFELLFVQQGWAMWVQMIGRLSDGR